MANPATLTTMDPASIDPLAQLEDISIPAEISQLPPLLVWLVVACMLAVIAICVWQWRRYQTQQQPLKQATSEIEQLEKEQSDYGLQCQQILRRLCLAYYPRSHVAALTDQAWYQFLDQHLPEQKRGCWPELVGNPYAPSNSVNCVALKQHCLFTTKAIAKKHKAIGEAKC